MIGTKNLKIIKFIGVSLIFSIPLLLFALTTQTGVHAHPVDISFTYINLEQDNLGDPLESDDAYVYISMNWLSAAKVMGYEEDPTVAYEKITTDSSGIIDYVDENFTFTNNGKSCSESFSLIELPDPSLFYLNGLELNVEIECSEDLEGVEIQNSVLFDVMKKQTNNMTIFVKDGEIIFNEPIKTADKIVIINNNSGEYKVSTREGSLTEEAQGESKEKRQEQNDEGEAKDNNEDSSKTENAGTASWIDKQSDNNGLLNRLNLTVLDGFSELVGQKDALSVGIILLLVAMIGALHSFEGGHNKVILAGMMINEEIDLRGSILYVFIFTLTHMSDIIILAIGLLVFDTRIALFDQYPQLVDYAKYSLITLATIILIKEMVRFYRMKGTEPQVSELISETSQASAEVDDSHEDLLETANYRSEDSESASSKTDDRNGFWSNTFKEQFMVAFISGLAPCLTGYTVFALIVSAGMVWLIVPATIAFGVGVFTVLITFAYLFDKFKSNIGQRFAFLTRYSAIISALLILFSSIILL